MCVPGAAAFEAARAALASDAAFTVVRASIVSGSHGCLARAGNSFGGMSGGVDGVVNTHLSSYSPGEYVQARVKRAIVADYAGELPVGCAVAVATLNPRHRVLVYAPTMRVPAPLPPDTIAPYLAFRAVLLKAAACQLAGISVPLFGTGAGEVPVARACAQMLRARASIARLPPLVGADNELTSMHADHRELLASP